MNMFYVMDFWFVFIFLNVGIYNIISKYYGFTTLSTVCYYIILYFLYKNLYARLSNYEYAILYTYLLIYIYMIWYDVTLTNIIICGILYSLIFGGVVETNDNDNTTNKQEIEVIKAGSGKFDPLFSSSTIYLNTVESLVIKPNNIAKIKTGITLELPENYICVLYAGDYLKNQENLILLNNIIDNSENLSKELIISVKNFNNYTIYIPKNQRIVKLICIQTYPLLNLLHNYKEK
jgi:dUTPase